MTAEQLSRLREIVEDEIREIRQALDAWRACNGLDENGDRRVEDCAARVVYIGWKEKTEGRLTELRLLLDRMDEDEFGICEECGEDIPWRRLELLPATTHCARCMTRLESAAHGA